MLARTSGSPFGRHFESRPHWLPDGSGVAVARRVTPEGIWAVEVIGLDGTTRVVAPQIGEEFDLSPDGHSIVYQLTDYRLGFVIAEPGERGRVYRFDDLIPTGPNAGMVSYGGLAWSPDGREVAFYISSEAGENDFALRVYALDVETGKTRTVGDIRSAAYADLAWKPNAPN
jgi:hypothetical protein